MKCLHATFQVTKNVFCVTCDVKVLAIAFSFRWSNLNKEMRKKKLIFYNKLLQNTQAITKYL